MPEQSKEDSYRHRMLSACIIGLAAGISAIALESGVWYLSSLRVLLSTKAPAIVVLPLFGLAGGLLSGYLVQKFSPTAYGSGIPQVRAFLLGVPIPLDLRLAVVKLLAGSIALGSGLFMGREGPTVHMGAAIAAHLNRFFPCSKERTKQLVAAGSGAGLAAAFNAPIAGVLFVVEELLKDTSNVTVGTALVACFVASVCTHLFNAPHMESTQQLRALQVSFAPLDMAFWLLLGILAGVFGTIFNQGVLVFLKIYRDYIKIPVALRVGLAGLISGIIIAIIPTDAHFRDYAALQYSIATGQTEWYMVPVAFLAFFFLTLLAYGSGAPGGLFAPALVLGSALGAMTSFIESYLFNTGSAETMALIGMGAFFAAVARVPITAVVIIFEITGHYQLVLPLMVTCATAIFIGSKIEKGSVYDMLRDWSGLRTAEESAGPYIIPTTADEIMSKDLIILDATADQETLLQILSVSPTSNIAIIDNDTFLGFLDRKTIYPHLKFQAAAPIDIRSSLVENSIKIDVQESITPLLKIFSDTPDGTIAVLSNGKIVGQITAKEFLKMVKS